MQNSATRSSPCRMTKVVLATVFGFLIVFTITHKSEPATSNTVQKRGDVNDAERCSVLGTLSAKELSEITELDLKGCGLQEIPSTIRHATNLQKLDISNNPLVTIPAELSSCVKLDVLFASSCPSITSLPPVLGKMHSITRLGWRSGSLTEIDPDALPPSLVHLILTDNQISKMDNERVFEKMSNVRKLMLSHNQICSFGSNGGIERMHNLELLRLGGNLLDKIPDGLWKLPKLTWLTISGNPITNTFKSNMPVKVPSIKMSDLKPTGKFLGKGASGKVELYEWDKKQVAVKLIHGVTSDGNAEDELAIYSAVGSVGVENRVVGCLALLDDTRKGVVMEALPSDLNDFALPPTIVEVTEDRWDSTTSSLSESFVKNALSDSIHALSFLHSAGVSHGDFYAHNMKVDRYTGRVFLLDFGASYFKGDYAIQAEKLEVRAFGVLVLELLRLMEGGENELNTKLESLHAQCTNTIVSDRPTLADIEVIVKSL